MSFSVSFHYCKEDIKRFVALCSSMKHINTLWKGPEAGAENDAWQHHIPVMCRETLTTTGNSPRWWNDHLNQSTIKCCGGGSLKTNALISSPLPRIFFPWGVVCVESWRWHKMLVGCHCDYQWKNKNAESLSAWSSHERASAYIREIIANLQTMEQSITESNSGHLRSGANLIIHGSVYWANYGAALTFSCSCNMCHGDPVNETMKCSVNRNRQLIALIFTWLNQRVKLPFLSIFNVVLNLAFNEAGLMPNNNSPHLEYVISGTARHQLFAAV